MVIASGKQTHVNPVYGIYFADPFVWKHNGTYYAIGSGELEASGQTLGKVFPVLQSSDFFQWSFASNALARPDPGLGDNFWAPAVAEEKGCFYLRFDDVAAVAFGAGFTHLGRFALAYRQLYGESPSQTLRRARRRS